MCCRDFQRLQATLLGKVLQEPRRLCGTAACGTGGFACRSAGFQPAARLASVAEDPCSYFFPLSCHCVNGDRTPRTFTFRQYGTPDANARSTAGRTCSSVSMVSPPPPNPFIT